MQRSWIVLCLLTGILAACGASPKSQAADWADRFPEAIGVWEYTEDRLELTAENQSSYGHLTLLYEYDGEADTEAITHITIDVLATESAADVEIADRMRTWELNGARFERERIGGTPIDVATVTGGYLAYFQDDETIITLSVIPAIADEDTGELAPLPPAEELEILLETVIAISENRE